MKKRRYLGVGWFWFLGTLVPVIGLVPVGMQALGGSLYLCSLYWTGGNNQLGRRGGGGGVGVGG